MLTPVGVVSMASSMANNTGTISNRRAMTNRAMTNRATANKGTTSSRATTSRMEVNSISNSNKAMTRPDMLAGSKEAMPLPLPPQQLGDMITPSNSSNNHRPLQPQPRVQPQHKAAMITTPGMDNNNNNLLQVLPPLHQQLPQSGLNTKCLMGHHIGSVRRLKLHSGRSQLEFHDKDHPCSIEYSWNIVMVRYIVSYYSTSCRGTGLPAVLQLVYAFLYFLSLRAKGCLVYL
mmetsp:Transcript_34713/g.44275  ORF Transcript_34713/g.44275 Transcript_34713/m.44275 type:complete len:232 (+) Transcript_34713:990-1685(+)